MLPDRVSNPGPLTYESGALATALRGPARRVGCTTFTVYKLQQMSVRLHRFIDKRPMAHKARQSSSS